MCSAISTASLPTRAHSPSESAVLSSSARSVEPSRPPVGVHPVEPEGGDGERGLELSRFLANPKLKLRDRLAQFSDFIAGEYRRDLLVRREVVGPTGRSVRVRDLATGQIRPMLMFGSNNYLGLANDPLVLRRVRECLSQFGAGVAGPPMLNGTTTLHRNLEAQLSRLKGAQSALLYSSGYAANIGWLAGLVGRRDVVVLDERSHASAFDGAKLARGHTVTFRHNDVADLSAKLAALAASGDFVNLFVSVEGVYSMDGDLAPLDEIVAVCRQFDAFLVVDDAHGTGVMGEHGRGVAEHFGVEGRVDLVMGTFSKTFAVNGGFLAGRTETIEYLRFFSHPHFFSASLPPMTVAAVLAGLEVIETQPQRRTRLHANVRYLVERLHSLGVDCRSQSAILAIPVPQGIRRMARRLHDAGIFVNAIEYPAVPKGAERLRVSLCSEHTRCDLDQLLAALATVFARGRGPWKHDQGEPR
jgi:glycine C-acetyltransferase